MNTIREHLPVLLLVSTMGSVAMASPPAYDPMEIRDAEFDAVATKSDGKAAWIYEGSASPDTVLANPKTPSEWWDGTVIRLLPGDSVMQGIPGDFAAGVGFLVGVNARLEGSGSPHPVFDVSTPPIRREVLVQDPLVGP